MNPNACDLQPLCDHQAAPMTRRLTLLFLCLFVPQLWSDDSVTPYTADNVPQDAIELWKDVDFRKEPLDVQVVKEWREDGIVCRYIIFKVGTFKGTASRCAAFYTFPEGMKNGPAFVWAHGGGQRADRARGRYFAKQGFATIDYNWGGREMVDGIQPNTDWGNVDPSQGPKFYPGALRPSVKLNLLPDEHTIDSVVSPRNGIWYLLTYAGRRAITFLEQQPEVDPEKIGFTGYSMGGNITSMAAIDDRLKAVIPMVGGSGFIMDDFPGMPDTGRARGFKNIDLYNRTIDAQAYWPNTKCPVLFLSASDDFHAVFDNVYKSVKLIPHRNWLASQLMHYNHSLGPEQWVLVNLWFDKYLKGQPGTLPTAGDATLQLQAGKNAAVFAFKPDQSNDVSNVSIYYSHDANARSRFWHQAPAERAGDQWIAKLPVRKQLPLYAFANVEYPLNKPTETFQGVARSFTITSNESVYLPEDIDSSQLRADAKLNPVFEDFDRNGFGDWAMSPRGGISTYKFQDPERVAPTADYAMRITVNVPREKLNYRFRIGKRKFLIGVKGPQQTFFANRNVEVGDGQQIVLRPSDFTEQGKKNEMKDWNEISTFRFDVYDGAARTNLHFTESHNQQLIDRIEWIRD